MNNEPLSAVMTETVEKMRSRNLSLVAFNGRRGSKRYLLSNNEIVARQTAFAMIKRGLLELIGERDGKAHYRLKVK